jgi:hypothetical protein
MLVFAREFTDFVIISASTPPYGHFRRRTAASSGTGKNTFRKPKTTGAVGPHTRVVEIDDGLIGTSPWDRNQGRGGALRFGPMGSLLQTQKSVKSMMD